MSSPSRLTFHGVTRAMFARLQKKARRNGICAHRAKGGAVKDGVRISWKYNADTTMLEVDCVSTVFWIDGSHVSRRVTEEIEATLGTRQTA